MGSEHFSRITRRDDQNATLLDSGAVLPGARSTAQMLGLSIHEAHRVVKQCLEA